MLRYIISTLAFFVFSVSFAQDTEVTTVVNDTIPTKENYNLRVGIDVSKPIRMLLEDDYQGFEIVADFRLTKKFYLAAELGNEKKTVAEDQLNFTTQGSFVKVGFDFNAYENWFGMQNSIIVGMRYGFSTHSQTLNSYSIYQSNQHLEDESILTQSPGTEFSSLNGHWVEVVAGIKVELYDNIYMGFSFRLNRLMSSKEPENFQNLFIPGFNKVTSDSNIGAGFNYTISYSIPIYKKAKKKKVEEEDVSKK
ncbi:hypothetical protein IMCC3317_14780 [Kordia antarctica]|uniref:Outer membrane protein beta-barrel domain-containing protein n=1 Tax=Kordia antarctica TaxID=1218801 RepID=A0A7L4ZJN3_9FLAO|nr:DUF6048 family protein [Kordia antarctica]QHI36124.1 hypothetical protein IMCC3317_14780 [Kordia antarctica]